MKEYTIEDPDTVSGWLKLLWKTPDTTGFADYGFVDVVYVPRRLIVQNNITEECRCTIKAVTRTEIVGKIPKRKWTAIEIVRFEIPTDREAEKADRLQRAREIALSQPRKIPAQKCATRDYSGQIYSGFDRMCEAQRNGQSSSMTERRVRGDRYRR